MMADSDNTNDDARTHITSISISALVTNPRKNFV